MEEELFIHKELARLYMVQSYKLFYEMMEDYYDQWEIPPRFRSILRIHEWKYIMLMIHDVDHTSEVHQAQIFHHYPAGKIFDFYDKFDPIDVARAKWLCTIHHDYVWFWNTLHSFANPLVLSYQDAIKFQDIKEIVKFINPKTYYLALNKPTYCERLLIIQEKAKDKQAWIVTRHKFFYEYTSLASGNWHLIIRCIKIRMTLIQITFPIGYTRDIRTIVTWTKNYMKETSLIKFIKLVYY